MNPSNTAKSELFEVAKHYVASGLSVLSIKADGSKAPACPAWEGFQHSLPTHDQLIQLFLGRNVGIGIIAGEVSGNLEVLDFDQSGVFDQYSVEVEAIAPGLIAKLTHHQTPRPGDHLAYRCPVIAGNLKLAQVPEFDSATGKLKPKTIIETRGEGGYVIAPGSPAGCHPTGGMYVHVSGPPITEVATITPEERELLFSVAKSFNEWVDPVADIAAPISANSTLPLKSPGDDFARRTDWPEILEPHGWAVAGRRSAKINWRRPGKDRGYSATTGLKSAAGNELLCVFSTNAHPFEVPVGRQCGTFTKFAAYTLLNHNGDYSASAKCLASLGYGGHITKGASDHVLTPSPAETKSFIAAVTVRNLITNYPKMRLPVVHKLLRDGETMNVIAPPKVGKSWLVTDLALCFPTGRLWLDTFAVERGKVLIVDNELHGETSANRIPTVADARGIPLNDYADQILVANLRGQLENLYGLRRLFDQYQPGDFKVIIIDAFYRAIPAGTDENDNGALANLYNVIDRYALQIGCAFILIHHASKGNQSSKTVTDVGAGAGAQSRATDTHLVLRPHMEPGAVVVDAAIRFLASDRSVLSAVAISGVEPS